MLTISKGDRVWFRNGRRTIFGTVKSVNQKTYTLIECSDGPRGWRAHKYACRLVTASDNDPGAAPAPVPLDDSVQAALVASAAPAIGLPVDCFGKTFKSGRRSYRITAINLNRPKYPVSAERVPDGKGFKFPAQLVIERLGSPSRTG